MTASQSAGVGMVRHQPFSKAHLWVRNLGNAGDTKGAGEVVGRIGGVGDVQSDLPVPEIAYARVW